MNAPLRFFAGERIEIVTHEIDGKPAVIVEADVAELADAYFRDSAYREALAGYDEHESEADFRERLRRLAEVMEGEV